MTIVDNLVAIRELLTNIGMQHHTKVDPELGTIRYRTEEYAIWGATGAPRASHTSHSYTNC
jgi:hypothetical protein